MLVTTWYKILKWDGLNRFLVILGLGHLMHQIRNYWGAVGGGVAGASGGAGAGGIFRRLDRNGDDLERQAGGSYGSTGRNNNDTDNDFVYRGVTNSNNLDQIFRVIIILQVQLEIQQLPMDLLVLLQVLIQPSILEWVHMVIHWLTLMILISMKNHTQ